MSSRRIDKSSLARSGFTLVEALISLAILGGGIIALLGMFSTSLRIATRASRQQEAASIAQRELEMLTVSPLKDAEVLRYTDAL